MSHSDGFCPNCGDEIPPEAKACPGCGSCEETGWSERARYESIGVDYDDSFDYETYVDEEFGDAHKGSSKSPMQWIWMIVALLLIILFIKWYFPI